MAAPVMKFYRTTSAKLNLLEVKDGQLIFVEDSKKIYLDNSTERIEYGSIISLISEEQRKQLLFPIDGAFYFVKETNCFWRYEGKWIQLTSTPETQIYFLNDLPDIGVENKLYVSNEKIYQWSNSTYTEVGGSTWDSIK